MAIVPDLYSTLKGKRERERERESDREIEREKTSKTRGDYASYDTGTVLRQ